MSLVAIEINEREARIFRFMRETGCFDVSAGSITLSFDKEGEVRSIKKEIVIHRDL